MNLAKSLYQFFIHLGILTFLSLIMIHLLWFIYCDEVNNYNYFFLITKLLLINYPTFPINSLYLSHFHSTPHHFIISLVSHVHHIVTSLASPLTKSLSLSQNSSPIHRLPHFIPDNPLSNSLIPSLHHTPILVSKLFHFIHTIHSSIPTFPLYHSILPPSTRQEWK